MPNFRAGGPMQRTAPEFRRGDRAWFGAPIAELPDLSAVRMTLPRRRSRSRAACSRDARCRVRVDAVPDRELRRPRSTKSRSSRKPDFTSFPPVAQLRRHRRARPTPTRACESGMSASARHRARPAARRHRRADSRGLLSATAPRSSMSCRRRSTEPRPVTVARRSRDRVAIAAGLRDGERIALRDPTHRGRDNEDALDRRIAMRRRRAARRWPRPAGRGVAPARVARSRRRACSAGGSRSRVHATGDLRATRSHAVVRAADGRPADDRPARRLRHRREGRRRDRRIRCQRIRSSRSSRPTSICSSPSRRSSRPKPKPRCRPPTMRWRC